MKGRRRRHEIAVQVWPTSRLAVDRQAGQHRYLLRAESQASSEPARAKPASASTSSGALHFPCRPNIRMCDTPEMH